MNKSITVPTALTPEMNRDVQAPVSIYRTRAPDEIIAEVWETKRRINAEAGYDIAELIRMVRAFSENQKH